MQQATWLAQASLAAAYAGAMALDAAVVAAALLRLPCAAPAAAAAAAARMPLVAAAAQPALPRTVAGEWMLVPQGWADEGVRLVAAAMQVPLSCCAGRLQADLRSCHHERLRAGTQSLMTDLQSTPSMHGFNVRGITNALAGCALQDVHSHRLQCGADLEQHSSCKRSAGLGLHTV